MGGRPPSPRVEYIPAPPPPVTVETPTQSLRTQIELAKVSGEQNNKYGNWCKFRSYQRRVFIHCQDLRRYRARGAEDVHLLRPGQEERAYC